MCRTAEHVCEGHPDKLCDQIADRILDEAYSLAARDGSAADIARHRALCRTAIEVLAKGRLIVVSGETRLPEEVRGNLDVGGLVREVYRRVGYEEEVDRLEIVDHIQPQAIEIGQLVDAETGVNAGDQGIMVGYATDETPEFMPREWVLARNICMRLGEVRRNGTLPWLRQDGKSQVTLDPEGRIVSVVVAAQHAAGVRREEIETAIRVHVLDPVLGELSGARVVINGGQEGSTFVEGGPLADAGTVGRKIVVDAYGPQVPVGGGAYSGKDPSKVDRSGAYMARHIAKTIVAQRIGRARRCTVTLAFAIGQRTPEMVTAMSETGRDLSPWVHDRFRDLSPGAIIERFGLTNPVGWSYVQSAAYGHYGRDIFPWEVITDLETGALARVG